MWSTWMEGGVAGSMAGRVSLAVGTAVVGGVTAIFIYKKFFRPKKPPKNYPRDTVILHSVGRAPWAPCMSPYPVKLETYLRMAKIPHQVEISFQFSSKGKTPWMTYNGVEVADSQMCINYLNEKLNIDLSKHLTTKDKAIARAFQKLTEENLFWGAVLFRWVWDKNQTVVKSAYKSVPGFVWRRVSKRFEQMTHAQGMGRHSKEEVLKIIEDDLLAISTFLGDKPFFMGSEPNEVDCCMFAMLSQFVWSPKDPPIERLENLLESEVKNIVAYCERMKAKYWPDWEEICKPNE